MRNIFTKTVAVMALSVMTITVWASPITIPQDLGSYINWNNADVTGATVEHEGANIGSTGKNTVVTFALSNSTQQDYYLTFATGTQGGHTANLNVVVTNSSSDTVLAKVARVEETGAWNTFNNVYYYFLPNLAIGTYTLTISTKNVDSSYAGNWSKLAVHSAAQYTNIPSESNYDLSTVHGTSGSPRYMTSNEGEIGYLKNGYSSIFETLYMSEDAYLDIKMGIKKSHEGQIKVRVYDITDYEHAEVEQTFDVPNTSPEYSDQTFSLSKGVSKGFKRIRFDYIADHDDYYILNYNHLRFTKRADYSYIKDVQIDGVSLPGDGLYALRDNGGTYTFSENIYTTNAPTVTAELNDGTSLSVSNIVDGTNVNYTITNNSNITATLTVEGLHTYSAGTHDETVDLKYTSAGKSGDNTWSNGTYTIVGENLDGNNGNIFKFSHQGNGIHTLSVPATIIVKQIVIKNWSQNYDCATPSTIISVSSTGATAIYVPTDNAAAPKNSTRDLVINIDGHVAGTPIVISMALPTQTNGWFELKVEKQNYTRPHPHMNLNTLCFPYQIDSYTGATFYTILSTEVEAGELTKLVLEEHEGALEAGVPYFYDPAEGETELVCYYSGDRQETPQTAANGAFIGAYVDNTAVPEGSYVTVNNQLYKCGANVTLAEYRAYVTPATFGRAAIPGRRQLRIGGANMPTGIDQIVNGKCPNGKFIKDGQLFIIRDGKTYNAMGQKLR